MFWVRRGVNLMNIFYPTKQKKNANFLLIKKKTKTKNHKEEPDGNFKVKVEEEEEEQEEEKEEKEYESTMKSGSQPLVFIVVAKIVGVKTYLFSKVVLAYFMPKAKV